MKVAYRDAFNSICEYVEKTVIAQAQVERLTMLHERFLAIMQEIHPKFYNPNYRTQKLKEKLSLHFGTRIQFWAPNQRSQLVYSSHLPVGQAVEIGFVAAASEERRLEEAALTLRRLIIDASRQSTHYPWPPSASFLLSDETKPPKSVLQFMKTVLSGKKAITEKKEVVASSIAQDMCYAVTNGTWKMPKHVLLGTAIRHLTGSAEMISITNHFGHCISHSSVLELETDVCNSLLQSNSLLPATILKEDNVTLHFCWDNFDLQEETASGAGTTHSAHGIAIQEVTSGTQVTTHLQELEQQHSSRQRTVDYQPQPLQPCFVNQKVEPKLNIVETRMFHFLCSYMAALGKLVRGSGLGDVIVQSGICASGSIEAVLAGKHYNRALRVHKVVLESLQRLLLEQFLNESTEATELFQQLSDDLQLCKDRLQLEAILSKPSAVRFFNLYTTFKERIISGEKGSTPQFWLQYAERVWLILRLLRATNENDFDLHLSCLQDMCPLLFAMDHHNYARYATVYFLHMLNLSHNHPDAIQHLRQGGFSVARSSVPACRIPVDQTIEQTINCQAKSKGGIVGFSRNSAAYFRWCMTRHVRASFLAATLEMAGMTGDDVNKVHKDLQPSGTRTSEDNVKRMTESFLSFMNPFSVEEPGLYCLSSGMPAPESVQEALLSADTRGKEAFNIFITERLVNKTLSFHAPLKKVGLKTFASVHKTKTVRASSNKTIQVAAQRDIFGQLMMISQENNINLQKVMCYPLSPIPWSMATPDGMPAKTDKSKLMQLLEKEQVLQDLDRSKCTSIVDGMVLLHSLTALPSTFAELADKVLRCLPASTRVDFVADTYHPDSIKMMERIRRGQSETFLLSGPNTKVKYVNQLRFDLLKEKFDTKKGPLLACYNGTDLSLLPPCQCTLQMHIQRVHYQVEVWKSAGEAQPAIDGPAGRGWEITEEGGLEIRWSEEDILPQELVDILCDQQVPEEENEDFELVNLCDAVQEEGCEEGCDTEESTNE
ncbi:hypothetical protein ACOMHN_019099 [Nucella lapillus]